MTPFALRRILFPVDFSERSLGAARYVKALAIHFGAPVTMIHALPPPHYEFSALEVGSAALNELFAARSVQMTRELECFLTPELEGVELKRELIEGDPAKVIVEQATHGDCQLIVMPTHGYGSFRRFILGSVTAKVLHDADCPVWTGVHMEQAAEVSHDRIERVMCAVDLGPQSARTLAWAAGLAKSYGAELTLLHAIPAMVPDPETAEADTGHSIRAEVEKALRGLLFETAASAQCLVQYGDPPKAVCEAAGRARSDVLVIARGSAAGVFGRLRANAYAIIRQSPCPVISV